MYGVERFMLCCGGSQALRLLLMAQFGGRTYG